jgi:outer membrane protein TolC
MGDSRGRRVRGGIALAVLALSSGGLAQDRDRALTLESCILLALKNNLGLAIEGLNPVQAELAFGFVREKYIPSLGFSFSSASTSAASFSWIEATAQVTSADRTYAASVSQLLPTGGRVSAGISSYKSESNRSFQTINPRYGSTLSFSFWQPLLRNFGLELNRRDIRVARNNLDISETQFRAAVEDTILRVEQAYWNLVYAVENLEVRRQSLALARDLLVKNRREAEVGTIAPIEVLNAESEVATREADILEAESAVSSRQDQLLVILNLEASEAGPRTARVIPLDKPAYEARLLALEECLATALANRTDLQVYRIDLETKLLTYAYWRNQLLPDLSFSASIWSPGVSGTRLLYQDDNPLTGVVTGTVPGGAAASIRDALGFKYRNWSVGLSLSVPIQNYLTRGHFASIKLSQEQALLRIKNVEQQVYLEVKNAVRDVETNYKRVQAYRVARDLAERKLVAEEKKLKVGLTTNYLVLIHQRDLANARTSELKAVIDYNLSLAALDRTLGTSLKRKNIRLSDIIPKS